MRKFNQNNTIFLYLAPPPSPSFNTQGTVSRDLCDLDFFHENIGS